MKAMINDGRVLMGNMDAESDCMIQERPSILVVDDEIYMVAELQEALVASGYSVLTASSASIALELINRHSDIGVMISDIRMPEINGTELTVRAKAARTEANALEVILITGHGTFDEASAQMPNCTFQLIRKPFRMREIFAATESAMSRSMERREAAGALQR